MTIATEFEREIAVHLHLVDNRIFAIPEILSVDSLRRRYIVAAMSVEEDEGGHPCRLTFDDGSIAAYDEQDRRIWREVQ